MNKIRSSRAFAALLFLAALCALWPAVSTLVGLAALPLGATLVVNTGRAIATNLISGIGGTVPKFVAWGTGAGTAGATDTTLFTESSEARTSGTVTRTTTTTTSDTVTVVGAITATAGRTITNGGLFDASTTGNLYTKGDFTGLAILTGDSIQFTWNITYS